jgi:hypothetical protein
VFEIFLNPWLLGGALFVGVPVVLHLIMRQQPQKLEFPALRFIRQREQSNRRRMKLRHLLLLILRCLAILLLAVALARPHISASNFLAGQEAPVAAALVFDTSPRMLYKQQNQTRLEAAQATAQWLLPQFPAESDVAVIDTSLSAPAFSVDRGAAKQRIEHLEPVAAGRSVMAVLEEALRLVADKEKPRKEVYVFTDLSHGGWSTAAAASLRAKIADAKETTLYVIDVGAEEPHNLRLGDIHLSGQLLPQGAPWRLESELIATGLEGSRAVKLLLPDKQGKLEVRHQQTVEYKAGLAQPLQFTVGGWDAPGVYQGLLKIEGEDALPVDDTRYFTVEVRAAQRILLVAAPPIDRHVDALRRALSGRFLCDTAATEDLARKSLSDYSAICLLDPSPLPPVVWQQLSAFVKQGGGLALFLGRNAIPKDTFNDPLALELLPGKLARQVNAVGWNLHLAPNDFEHPVLTNFKPIRSTVPWSFFPVIRYWQLEDLEPGTTVVIPYSDGRPALLERVVPGARGRVLTLTTPISDPASDKQQWNTLATGDDAWPFVMLSNEMLLYLVGSERLNYTVGELVELHVPQERQQASYILTTPRGDQIPEIPDLKQGTLSVTTTDLPGQYMLRSGGTEGGAQRGFSANLRADATNLERLTEKELNELFGEKKYHLAHTKEEIVRDLSTGRVGWELYPLLFVLAAIVMSFEHLLASRFYRQKVKPDAVARKRVAVAESAPA